MTAPTPTTNREWVLNTDAEISVSVAVADDNFIGGTAVTIRDDASRGTVMVYHHSIAELIAVLQAAVDA